jgi:ferric-dicitrate binding protein FerR (iron transport regulator)
MATFQTLFEKYLAGTGTPDEMKAFWQMVSDNPSLLEQPLDGWWRQTAAAGPQKTPQQWEQVQANIYARAASWEATQPAAKRVVLGKWKWMAASLLILVAAGTVWLMNKKESPQVTVQTDTEKNILPGRTGALLQLADGRMVSLDSLKNGQLMQQGNSTLVYADGNLSYQEGRGAAAESLFNTMSTPNGRQFHLKLPDGSLVWLNAASSITYPVAFNGKERKIKVKGEVFLEVKQDSRKPFTVDVDGKMITEVLGTSFNINSYENENNIRITLVDGSVRVITSTDKRKMKLLKPGQQAVQQNNELTVSNSVNMAAVMAWKNGLFNLEGVSVEELLRQVARWYDLQIVYRSKPPQARFHGELGRDLQLSQILDALKEAEIRYKQEGRTLIIE